MGLFKALKKIGGKVLKAGLSVATRGVSDKVLSTLKGLGRKPAGIKNKPTLHTEQEEALVVKMGQAAPRVRSTTVWENVKAGGAQLGNYKSKSGYKRKRGYSPGTRATPNWKARSYDEIMEAEARTQGLTRRKKKRATTSTGKRKPPPGGLDLRAMAQAWRAAGKPTTWQGWIKSQPIRRA